MPVNNKTIARNTMMLYLRMFLTMGVSLFTSRVILRTLGVEDFGIYSIVGGVIVMFSFISNCLKAGSQRFISYEIGLGQRGDVNKVVCKSVDSHVLISIVFLVLAETLGLWFVSCKLNIPGERVNAAALTYQISVVSFVLSILTAPFHSMIISYERMSYYAYISILDVLLKLAVAYLILSAPMDRMVFYAALQLGVIGIGLLISMYYCSKRLGLRYRYYKEHDLQKRIFSYSGWSMMNGFAVMSAQQGGNVLVNLFNGVVANASFGIANQVSNAVYGFVSNFQLAFQPQIVKCYASQEFTQLYPLLYRSSCFSYYLMLLFTVPFLSSMDYLLMAWLGNPPAYASVFCQLMLLYLLLDAYQAPLWMLIGATGKMKGYVSWSSAITIFNVPISWGLLYAGFPIYWVFVVRVLLNLLCCVIRPFYVRRLLPSFKTLDYAKHVVVRPLMVSIMLVAAYGLLRYSGLVMHSLVQCVIMILCTVSLIVTIGITSQERHLLFKYFISKL